MSRTRMHIDLKAGEVLRIGDAEIRLEKKSGQLARLQVIATSSTPISLPERQQNSAARMSAPTQSNEGVGHHGKHAIRRGPAALS